MGCDCLKYSSEPGEMHTSEVIWSQIIIEYGKNSELISRDEKLKNSKLGMKNDWSYIWIYQFFKFLLTYNSIFNYKIYFYQIQ